jgi:hypothetical protein
VIVCRVHLLTLVVVIIMMVVVVVMMMMMMMIIHLHYSVCKSLALKGHTNGTLTAKPVCEQEGVMVFWNQAVHTDREFMANGPDIIIKKKKEKTCIRIDVVVPGDGNVIQKKAEKKLKYKRLCIEIQ